MKRQPKIEPVTGTMDEAKYRTEILEFARKVWELDKAVKNGEQKNRKPPSKYPRYSESTTWRVCRRKPSGCYDDVEFPSYNDEGLKKALGRKWRICIRQLYLLVKLYKPLVPTNHVPVVTLCRTSKRLLETFGNDRGVEIAVGMAERCGLVLCVDEDYEHGMPDGENYAKLYAWDRDCAHRIVGLARKHHLTSRLPRSVCMKRVAKKHRKLLRAAKKKGDTSTIRISQRANLSLGWSDDEIVAALRANYPQLAWAQDTAIRLNKRLKDEEQISANPSIRRTDTRITKIGFRISNPLVALKTQEGKGSDRKWRDDYLDERFGEGGWIGYDIKSSIYRVHWLVNHGQWLANSIDLYARMVGFDFATKEERDCYKYGIAMKLYFETTPESLSTHLRRKGMDKATIDNNKQALKTGWDKMRDAIGEPIKSEIFLHEGCIYLEAYRRMVEDRGWEVVQVYDGFFIMLDGRNGDDVIREAASIVEQSAYWYQRTFLSGVNQDDPTLNTGLDKGALQQ